MFKQRHP